MSFINDIRQELIDDGHASKFLLDYIDDRIIQTIDNRLMQGFADVEEHLQDELLSTIKRIKRLEP